MVQKTLRFYDDSTDDEKALGKLNNYKKYGYTSCRDMIIAAINLIDQRDENSSGNSSINVDELAEKIADRLNGKITAVASAGCDEKMEEKNNDDNYNKALSFMDSL